jgi:hypothetical protein
MHNENVPPKENTASFASRQHPITSAVYKLPLCSFPELMPQQHSCQRLHHDKLAFSKPSALQ